jgi:hypothetical protein
MPAKTDFATANCQTLTISVPAQLPLQSTDRDLPRNLERGHIGKAWGV